MDIDHIHTCSSNKASIISLLMDCRYLYLSIFEKLAPIINQRQPLLDLDNEFELHMQEQAQNPNRFNEWTLKKEGSLEFRAYRDLKLLPFRFRNSNRYQVPSSTMRSLNFSRLQFALMDTNYPAVKEILSSGNYDVNQIFIDSDRNWLNAIGYVIFNDQSHYETAFIIRLLKESGYEIDFLSDGFSYTPLQIAIILGKLHLIHILLECGADPTIGGGYTCEDSLTLAKRLYSGIEHQQQHHSIIELLETFIESNPKRVESTS